MDHLNTLDLIRLLNSGHQFYGKSQTRALNSLKMNHLLGFAHTFWRTSFAEKDLLWLKNEHLEQLMINRILLDETYKLEDEALKYVGHRPTRLKGIALIEDLYTDVGVRHLTDIDLLVAEKDFESYQLFIESQGYNLVKQPVFIGNAHKLTFEKKHPSGLMLYVDLHCKLYWGQRELFYENYEALKLHEHYVHMLLNWGYQDTFVGLKALVDLWQLWDRMTEQERVKAEQLALSLKVGRTWSLVAQVRDYISGDGGSPGLLSGAFLDAPKNYPGRYLWLKHITKPSFLEALRYDWEWFKAMKF